MTLHKEFREDSLEDLDILIRVALRESVAEAEAPPRVWEKIDERVRRMETARQARDQVSFDPHLMLPSAVRVSTFYLFAGDALRIW
jgi:hypothetical protein